MIDFDTAVNTALSPAVTIPVIAGLTIVVAGQWYDNSRRLKAQAVKNAATIAKVITTSMKAMIDLHKAHRERELKIIEAAVETLTEAELLGRRATTDDLLYGVGNSPFSMRRPTSFRRPVKAFSLGDILDIIGKKAQPFDPDRVGGGSGIARGGSPSVDDFLADIQKPKYDHNAGPLEAAAAEGRTHADVMDEAAGEKVFSPGMRFDKSAG